MFTSFPLDSLPLWAVYLVTALLLIVGLEAGFYLGKFVQRRWPDRSEPGVGTMVGAALALLGFMMTFITGISIDQLNLRRDLIVKEANAIGSAYLEAGFLGEPHTGQSRDLLRGYVDERLRVVAKGETDAAIQRSEEIHEELWAIVEPIGRDASTPAIATYITSLAKVFDVHAERVDAEVGARLPPDIMIGVYGVAFLTMMLVGLYNSYRDDQNGIAMILLVMVLSLIFLLIVDLDRPYTGIVQVPQQALIELQRQLLTHP